MGKRKGKQTASLGAGGRGRGQNKTGGRAAGGKTVVGKPTGGKTTGVIAARPSETEIVNTYGVVPSEYNIQAQINWLTAPPSTNDKKNSGSSSQQAPSKKPQRGFHKDTCEACGEGDYLMYCDKCPVAFHAICDDPPLPPEDFEIIGLNWKCKRCRNAISIKEEIDEIEPPEPAKTGFIGQFFQQAISQLNTQNPTQFKLPKDMPSYDYPFPGTSRHLIKKSRQRTSVVEVENGMVPKPVAKCFTCQKSCRMGALIQCDKCDMYFHLDCLDPPLTTIPTCIWVCPLHIEPILESLQLTSCALSERLSIWEHGQRHVNRTAVVNDFFRKISRRNPMFKRKRPIPMIEHYEKVPGMIKNCYDNYVPYTNQPNLALMMLGAVCEIEMIHDYYQDRMVRHSEGWRNLYLPVGLKIAHQKAKLDMIQIKNNGKLYQLAEMMKICNADIPEYLEEQLKDVKAEGGETSTKPVRDKSWFDNEIKTMFMELRNDEKQLKDCANTIKEVCAQVPPLAICSSANTTTTEEQPLPSKPQNESTAGTKKSSKRSSLSKTQSQMKFLPRKLVNKFAAAHINLLRRKRAARERKNSENKEKDSASSMPTQNPVLTLYVENVGVTIEMTRRNFWIGSDHPCDLKITDFVKCNRIDAKHAKVYFNPVENCWELLNYSPNGLYVNDTLFGFKGAGCLQPTVNSPRFQELLDKSTRRVDDYIRKYKIDTRETSACYCKPFPMFAMSQAFEGCAKLYPGSRVQLGCVNIIVQGPVPSP